MAASSADDAEQARASGNTFYKAGQFAKAEKSYEKASSLAPRDPAPVSNLSAVKYEMGDYQGAIDRIKEALFLSQEGDDNAAKKDKLYVRQAKCHLHLRDMSAAKKAISSISNRDMAAELSASLESLMTLHAEDVDTLILRKRVLDQIPQYKPWLYNLPEYYPVGHDQTAVLQEPIGFGMTGKEIRDISMLFVGSGDSRHVFSAISSLAFRGEENGPDSFKHLHVTMLDINPAALARALILFNMMYLLDTEVNEQGPHPTSYFPSMAYIFSCQIIPPFAYVHLQVSIKSLIKRLEGEEKPLPFTYVQDCDRERVIRVLKHWQQPWSGLATVEAAKKVVEKKNSNNAARARALGGERERGEEHPEKKDIDRFSTLLPSAKLAEEWEPSLSDNLADYRKTGNGEKLQQQIDSTWFVNNTLIDYDYANFALEQGNGSFPTIEFDPLHVVGAMDLMTQGSKPESDEKCAIEALAAIFRLHTISTMQLMSKKRVSVELVAGEMSDFMERVRHNVLAYRHEASKTSGSLDPTKFPQTYDYIHLSNVPDYIGGHLTTFLVGRPLLKNDTMANLRFNNLLNPPEFQSHEDFQSEYLLMHDMERIRDHFRLKRRAGRDMAKAQLPPHLRGLFSPFAFEGTMVWDIAPGKGRMTYDKLLPRADFEKWMYAHLLKICLPYPRPIFSNSPVHAPLNLTTLIRLMVAMFEMGYPVHWFTKILSSMCSGSISTTARPPTAQVTDSAAVIARHPPKEISVQPWIAEFTTLLSIWQSLIPFGMDSLGGSLVPLTSVNQYSITFPAFRTEHGRVPHFILLFWNIEAGYTLKPPTSIYDILSGRGAGAEAEVPPKDLLEKAVVCVTAFKYDAASRTASFPMRADKIDEMKSGKWNAFIWRTDIWQAVTDGVSVSEELVMGENWAVMA